MQALPCHLPIWPRRCIFFSRLFPHVLSENIIIDDYFDSVCLLIDMQQDPSSQAYADEVARLRASESDSDAELLVRFDIFS